MYRLTKDEDNKMRRDPVTSTYKKNQAKNQEKRKDIVKKSFDIIDRMNLINPAKNERGRISVT